jgi:raffinose/stachyose/melibiose transport system substrate-binding protein
MKKKSLFLIAVLSFAMCISACGTISEVQGGDRSVTLTVSTMYAGNDSNTKKYREAVAEWEEKTGNIVEDESTTSDDSYKKRIIMEFQSGAEPDVLFFFNGVDANPLVQHGRVVSLEEIREVYPDYAGNMKESMMPASPADGKIYAIPVNGYWEGLFVNKEVLSKAGVKMPDENTTWDEFMELCNTIKEKGYVPIAASLAEIPHYWFEFCIYNHQNTISHARVPEGLYSAEGFAWVHGLEDIKSMYEEGLFPENTLSISDEQSMKLFLNGEAAFMLDGSWRVGAIEDLGISDDFAVTFVPGTETRRTTDIISGLSSGYYITRKAWEDPEKREAAVDFVSFMTSDEKVSEFAEVTATALSDGVQIDRESLSPFYLSCLNMVESATGSSEAVQDYVPTNLRAPIFENMSGIVRGVKDIPAAVDEVITAVKKSEE